MNYHTAANIHRNVVNTASVAVEEQIARFWPRNESEVQSLTEQQFRWLMEGLTITPKHTVQEITPPQYPA